MDKKIYLFLFSPCLLEPHQLSKNKNTSQKQKVLKHYLIELENLYFPLNRQKDEKVFSLCGRILKM